MFCEVADRFGFGAVWVAFTVTGLVSMGILSSLVFVPLYAKPTLQSWRYKCNPTFPTPLLIKKEIVHTVKGLVVATLIPSFALVSSGSDGWTKGYCSGSNGVPPMSWARVGIEMALIISFTDLVEYCYHYLGHKYAFWWEIHKHHHGFYNPSPFAVIADEWPDQFVRTLPMLALPALWRINIDLLFICFAALFYGYGVYLHSGFETPMLSAHNPIFNTSFHHYTHHAFSVANRPLYTGFFFKIWDWLFDTTESSQSIKRACRCVECRPASERDATVWKKTIKPDYSVLLSVQWWLSTSINGVRE